MSIADNLNKIRKTIPENVTLVAISKTKPIEDIIEAYNCGQRIFGENKVQELTHKFEKLPKDIQWHFIGHLQTNKVKYIAPFVSLIHAIDSIKLLTTINKEAQKNNRIIDCLLQFHVAEEESKFGLNIEKAQEILNSEEFRSCENIRICGVMGMATYTNDIEQITSEFEAVKIIFDKLKSEYFSGNDSFSEISMGMSGDYQLAIEQGSTMVRIGSTIFGQRVYH